jgi:predicted TIM-barrel fold metal-dependent hydrolase
MLDVIDAQVHAYERNHGGRPWAGSLPGPAAVTGEDMVLAMDGAGVQQAVLVSPWTIYRTDASYAAEVYRAHPRRFRLVTPIDPFGETGADAVTVWASTPGAVGIRLMAGATEGFRTDVPEVTETVRAAQAADFPVCVYCPNQLSIMAELADHHPDTQFVLDHMGLAQPLVPPTPDDPFTDLPGVLALARYPNVAVKVTATCTLSHGPFPFEDLRAPLSRVFDAFGIERCMWGSDWTRTTAFASYPESVAAFRDNLALSPSERMALMGGVVRRIFSWSRYG